MQLLTNNSAPSHTTHDSTTTTQPTALVLGAGFGGLSTACYLAHAGYKVTVLEKNPWIGGRAQVWESQGFRFDMGPSFYWMPEVFERFFQDFGRSRSDYYTLQRLNPGYICVFDTNDIITISDTIDDIQATFESIETGAGAQLQSFLERSKTKYTISRDSFIYKQFSSLVDFINFNLIKHLPHLDLFTSYSSLVRKHFKSPKLRAILEYPTVFLGAPGNRIPGTYTLMNYVDLVLGTWYPQGGFSGVISAIAQLATELGVTIHTNSPVTSLTLTPDNKSIVSATCTTTQPSNNNHNQSQATHTTHEYSADIVVSALPYHYTESLLPQRQRQYSEKYWDSRVLAPSCLNFYIGLNTKLPHLAHHTFFFDRDWETHFADTYSTNKKWQDDPLFYVHIASKTDASVAPANGETLFILIPVAAGLIDTPQTRQQLRTNVIQRINDVVGFDITQHIVTERSYAHNDFVADYNALKGSGFGLGHTLFQTASFRPRNMSTTINNLYFAGQDTIPGTSTVMSLISGKVTSQHIQHTAQKHRTLHTLDK